jgi:hypothetical protein
MRYLPPKPSHLRTVVMTCCTGGLGAAPAEQDVIGSVQLYRKPTARITPGRFLAAHGRDFQDVGSRYGNQVGNIEAVGADQSSGECEACQRA